MLIADDGKGGLTGIVTSANPHDASSRHSNVALKLSGAALQPLLESELALAHESGWESGWQPPPLAPAPPIANPANAARVQVLTEGQIGAAILRNFAQARAGDGIDIAMFYLSDRNVIEALIAAAKRGVAVRVILDPNKDAFGREKNGIPNRSVAAELVAASDGAIKLRWYRTHGEQFHAKLVAMRTADEFWFMLGSANLTRRNIGDYNLEANIAVSVPPAAELAASISDLVRNAVVQQGTTGPGIHRRFRHLCRSGPGHLLALSPDGDHRDVHLLACGRRRLFGAERRCRVPLHLAERRRGRGFESRDDVAEPIVAGRRRTLRGETRQQRAIPMPSQGAVERHVNGRRTAAARVVGFEAAHFAAQVVSRRVRRRIVEHRREQAGTAQLVDDDAFHEIGSRRRPARRGIEIEALATAQQRDELG